MVLYVKIVIIVIVSNPFIYGGSKTSFKLDVDLDSLCLKLLVSDFCFGCIFLYFYSSRQGCCGSGKTCFHVVHRYFLSNDDSTVHSMHSISNGESL